MNSNFGDFTSVTSLSGSDSLVGYRTPTANGEIRTTASSLKSYINSGSVISNFWIAASEFIPRTTSGAGIDSRELGVNNYDELLFDAATTEFAQALTTMPSNYNNGSLNARFSWTANGATGSVVWGIQALSISNGSGLSNAFGSAGLSTGSITSNNILSINPATSLITLGGIPQANSPVLFQIYRDAANAQDNLSIDARLLGVEINYTSS